MNLPMIAHQIQTVNASDARGSNIRILSLRNYPYINFTPPFQVSRQAVNHSFSQAKIVGGVQVNNRSKIRGILYSLPTHIHHYAATIIADVLIQYRTSKTTNFATDSRCALRSIGRIVEPQMIRYNSLEKIVLGA